MIVHDPLRRCLTKSSSSPGVSTVVDTAEGAGPAAEPRRGGLLAGTRLRTPDGWQPVETLRRGDLVMTMLGDLPRAAPIVWIGRRHAHGPRALVRIRRDAIADNAPAADVVLAADHAVYIDGALYAPAQLVNGATLLWDLPSRPLWALQLDHHNVVEADGLLVETLLHDAARSAFAEVTAPRLRVVRKVGA